MPGRPRGASAARRSRCPTPRALREAAAALFQCAWRGTAAAEAVPSAATGSAPQPHEARPRSVLAGGPGARAGSDCAGPRASHPRQAGCPSPAPAPSRPRESPRPARPAPAGPPARSPASTREEAPRSAAVRSPGQRAGWSRAGRRAAPWLVVACVAPCAPPSWTRCCCGGSAWRARGKLERGDSRAGRCGRDARGGPSVSLQRLSEPWQPACEHAACPPTTG